MNVQNIRLGQHVYLLTDLGSKFRIAHDSIKEVAREAIFTFTPDGIELAGRDYDNTVMVRFVIKASDVRDSGGIYECNVDRVNIGINTGDFSKNLRSVTPADTWSLAIDAERPERIVMTTTNKASRKTICWEMNGLNIEDAEIFHRGIDSYEYPCVIMYPSVAFHDMMRDLGNSSHNIARICCDGKRLVVYSVGILNRVYFEIEDGEVEEGSGDKKKQKIRIFNASDVSEDKWPVCDSYHLMTLQRASKAKGFSSIVKIYLKRSVPHGYPVAMSYENAIGTLQFLICATEDTDWEPYESRKMPNKIGFEEERPAKKQQQKPEEEHTSSEDEEGEEEEIWQEEEEEEEAPRKKKKKKATL
jgi:hypothetical protein